MKCTTALLPSSQYDRRNGIKPKYYNVNPNPNPTPNPPNPCKTTNGSMQISGKAMASGMVSSIDERLI